VERKQLRNKRVKNFRKLKGSKFILLILTFVFLAVGCGGGSSSSPPPFKVQLPSAEKKKAEPVQGAQKVERKEPEKQEEVYSYNPAGKPDPFKPFIQLTPAKETARGARLTPLQKYDISQLKLVAIIAIPKGNNVALVEDAAGKGYFLKRGTVIGRNDGKVKNILKDRVIIEEVYQDIFGQTKVNEIPLLLHRAEEGGES